MAEDYFNDSLMDVESGVEALEETVDAFADVTTIFPVIHSDKPVETPQSQPSQAPTNFGLPPSQTNLKENNLSSPKTQFLNLTIYILACVLILSYICFPDHNSWNGFLFGICFVYLVGNLKDWIYDNYLSDRDSQIFRVKRNNGISTTYTIPSVKEHTPLKKYEVSMQILKVYLSMLIKGGSSTWFCFVFYKYSIKHRETMPSNIPLGIEIIAFY